MVSEGRLNNMDEDVVVVYKISQHCKTRYAERIMGKGEEIDVNRFVTMNEGKIKTDINKLIYYGQKIFSGKQSHNDKKNSLLDVYLKDTWIILVDEQAETVVTLYKIDLGLDDEFNKTYITRMLDKLNERKKELDSVQLQVDEETNMYKELIENTESQIKEYKTMIKNLEELVSGYKMIINNNNVKVSQANRDVADVINTMINKKEF